MARERISCCVTPGTKIYLDRTYEEYQELTKINKKYASLSRSAFVEQAVIVYCQKINDEVLNK